MKHARRDRLLADEQFSFAAVNIADRTEITEVFNRHRDVTRIIHLAAQPGVRHSLVDPYSYVEANVMGHLVMLEAARTLPRLDHFLYASSSSVYGGNKDLPYREDDRVDQPVLLYAATKPAE